jgi:lipopolysaccharide/colanic/teichoic acid biosynthesis glycosyltransferase
MKRAADILLGAPLFILAAPIIAIAGILVKLTSRGPILYCQTRVGRHGRLYTMYKVRTMQHDCERQSGPQWSVAGDPRITRVGRFLRRRHVDELPQLWNVLRGDMSLVGPRPERPEFVAQLEQAIPGYRFRLLVRPGLTGLAQVSLPSDTDIGSVRRKLQFDLCYVERLGLWLDLRILLGTIFHVAGIRYSVPCRWLRLPSKPPATTEVDRPAEPSLADLAGENSSIEFAQLGAD